jgi:hypothetical protein
MQEIEGFKSFKGAYDKLGYYNVKNRRKDWTAEKYKGEYTGVCLTLWEVELKGKEPELRSLDTRDLSPPLEDCNGKPGFRKRICHIKRAIREFDGVVDIIIIDSNPKEEWGVKRKRKLSYPCLNKDRRWRVTYFESDTGHFVVKQEYIKQN